MSFLFISLAPGNVRVPRDPIDVKNLKSNQLASLYLDQSTADVKFECGPDDGSALDLVVAHKVVLSSCSDVFKTMFYGSLPEKPTIRLTDASGDGFKEFLEFFYKSEINPTVEYAAEVIYLSKKYEVTDLLNVYSNFLQRKLTIDQMCQGLEVAMRFDITKLKAFCESEIINNHVKFFASEGFVFCSPNVLRTILNLEELKLYSEEIFVGCFRWARNALKRHNPTGNEPTLSEIRNQMGEFFDLIEYGSMKCQAITMILYEFNGLFTTQDLSMIYTILATKFPVKLDLSVTDCFLLVPECAKTPNEPKYYLTEDKIISFESIQKAFFVGYKHATIYNEGWAAPASLWLILTRKSKDLDEKKDVVLLRQKLITSIMFLSKNTLDIEEIKTTEPIMIEPNTKYELRIKSNSGYKDTKYFTKKAFAAFRNRLSQSKEFLTKKVQINSTLR